MSNGRHPVGPYKPDGVVEELAGVGAPPVAATPPQGIDRDALIALLRATVLPLDTWDGPHLHQVTSAEVADRILALVRPVEAEPQGIDRDTVLDRIRECAPAGMELRYDGTEDKYAAAYVAGVHAAHDAAAKALVRPVEGAHLDPERAAEVLDCCKREGGLDLYGWGDLISRLQDCIVPLPADAPAKVSEAYRQGYNDAGVAEQSRDAVQDLVEALRLTVEYVGLQTLPPLEGWSWYDALRRHAPEIAAHFVEQRRLHGGAA